MKERVSWIDALKGIGVILVVFGHTHTPFRGVIYSFHMPLFFFISGLLFRGESSSAKEFLLKKVKTLLIPYLVFSIISLLINILVYSKEVLPFDFLRDLLFGQRNYIPINQTLWFFTCLFVTEIIFYLLSKLKNTSLLTLVVITLSFLAYYTIFNTLSWFFSTNSSLYLLLFYLSGNLFSKKNVLGMKMAKQVMTVLSIPAFVIWCFPSAFILVNNIGTQQWFTAYFKEVILAFAGIILCVRLALALDKVDWLSGLGKYSLLIFPTHIFVLASITILLVSLGFEINYSNNIYCITVTIVTLILLQPIVKMYSLLKSKPLGVSASNVVDK